MTSATRTCPRFFFRTYARSKGLEEIYRLVDLDGRIKVVVLTGAGKTLCAGADLEAGFNHTTCDVDNRDPGGRVSLAIDHCSKPTIAAINGSAVGIDITIVLPCAIRVVSANAKCGFVFARHGIVMEACSSFSLPRLIGESRAIHLCTTGAVYPASRLLLNTLFSEVLPTPEATVTRALELADEVAQSTSVMSTKIMRDLIYYREESAEGAHLLDSSVIHGLEGGKDRTEGIRSFLEKSREF